MCERTQDIITRRDSGQEKEEIFQETDDNVSVNR